MQRQEHAYHVVASFARRWQKDEAAPALEVKYPTAYWWITSDCIHELRLPLINQ